MISGTSFNKWVVFKSALKRLKWLGILYAVTLFLELPMILWMELSKQKALQGNLLTQINNKSYLFQFLFNPLEHAVNIAVPIIFGLIIFQYLQKNRASTFFHSLPIKRWFLYLQNLLAGLVLIWLPIIINGILVYGVFTAFGITTGELANPNVYDTPMGMASNIIPNVVPVWQVISYWLLISLLMTGLFFIFTVFIGMLTGNLLLQGALTFIGLFLPLGFYLLVNYNLSKLLYGYPRDFNNSTIEWLSPMIRYLSDQYFRSVFQTPSYYIWYFLITLLLGGLSIYLYKLRNVEVAGETLAAGWIRWIFKYGVAICAALTGGLYFSTFNENSNAVLYIGYLIGAALGYIVADMIAYKSFHFYKRWKGMLIFGAVLILLFSSVKLDIFGYEKHVPNQETIKEVSLSNLNRDGLPVSGGLTDKDNIRRVLELHKAIIQRQEDNSAQEITFKNSQAGSYAVPPNPKNMIYPIEISYTLNNGAKVKRAYNINLYRYRQLLYPIFSSSEAKKIMYARLFQIDESKIDQISINNYHLGKNVRIYKPEEIKKALAALKKDVLNVSYEAAIEGKVPALATIEFTSKTNNEKNYAFYNLNYYQEFNNFEALLQEQGFTKELFLNPEEVSEIIIKKVGSNESAAVKNKQEIKTLLDWCNLEDERAFIMRQQQPENKGFVEYYGKIVKKSGTPIYVMFDNSPYGQEAISKIIHNNSK